MKKIVATALAAVVVGATAGAAPARAANPSWAYVENGTLIVQAAPFATNDVTVVGGGTGRPLEPALWVIDANADIQLDPARTGGCSRPEPDSIVCPQSLVSAASIRLGDQNDTLTNNVGNTNPAVRVEVSDGDGNDALYGNGGDDLLDAESGTGQPVNGGLGDDICRGAGVTRSGCELP